MKMVNNSEECKECLSWNKEVAACSEGEVASVEEPCYCFRKEPMLCYDKHTKCKHGYWEEFQCNSCRTRLNNEHFVIKCPVLNRLCPEGHSLPNYCNKCKIYPKAPTHPAMIILREIEIFAHNVLVNNKNFKNGYYSANGCFDTHMKGNIYDDMKSWCEEIRERIQKARDLIYECDTAYYDLLQKVEQELEQHEDDSKVRIIVETSEGRRVFDSKGKLIE